MKQSVSDYVSSFSFDENDKILKENQNLIPEEMKEEIKKNAVQQMS